MNHVFFSLWCVEAWALHHAITNLGFDHRQVRLQTRQAPIGTMVLIEVRQGDLTYPFGVTVTQQGDAEVLEEWTRFACALYLAEERERSILWRMSGFAKNERAYDELVNRLTVGGIRIPAVSRETAKVQKGG